MRRLWYSIGEHHNFEIEYALQTPAARYVTPESNLSAVVIKAPQGCSTVPRLQTEGAEAQRKIM